jgi:hypothetical protein
MANIPVTQTLVSASYPKTNRCSTAGKKIIGKKYNIKSSGVAKFQLAPERRFAG